jgi:hypothetical protein
LKIEEHILVKFYPEDTAAFPSDWKPNLDLDNFNDHIKQRPAFASTVISVPHHLALYTSSHLTAEVRAQFLARSFGILLRQMELGHVFPKLL